MGMLFDRPSGRRLFSWPTNGSRPVEYQRELHGSTPQHGRHSRTEQIMTNDGGVHELFGRFIKAWGDNNAAVYAACFTEDSDYVSYDCTRSAGRAVMQDAHDRLFRGVLTGSILVGEIESIRYLNPDTALIHANASVLTPWRSKLPRGRLRVKHSLRCGPTSAGCSLRCTTDRCTRTDPCARFDARTNGAIYEGLLGPSSRLGRARAGGAV